MYQPNNELTFSLTISRYFRLARYFNPILQLKKSLQDTTLIILFGKIHRSTKIVFVQWACGEVNASFGHSDCPTPVKRCHRRGIKKKMASKNHKSAEFFSFYSFSIVFLNLYWVALVLLLLRPRHITPVFVTIYLPITFVYPPHTVCNK